MLDPEFPLGAGLGGVEVSTLDPWLFQKKKKKKKERKKKKKKKNRAPFFEQGASMPFILRGGLGRFSNEWSLESVIFKLTRVIWP